MDLPGNIRLLGGRIANKGACRGVLEQEIGLLCVMTSDLFLLPVDSWDFLQLVNIIVLIGVQ